MLGGMRRDDWRQQRHGARRAGGQSAAHIFTGVQERAAGGRGQKHLLGGMCIDWLKQVQGLLAAAGTPAAATHGAGSQLTFFR